MTRFGEAYASVYDLLYGDKGYVAECDLLQKIVGAPPRRLAEIGCGTGSHALELARRGYAVVGLDASREMLARAEQKLRRDAPDLDLRFVHADMRDARLGGLFDAVLCMFAAIGYVIDNRGLERTLASFRAQLPAGGMLLFDCWYGPAVLHTLPEKREKRVAGGGVEVVRRATPELDVRRHVCTTHYELELTRDGHTERFTEAHPMRFFFPQEVELLLHHAGFALERLVPFPEVDRPLDESCWNVLVVARAT